MSINSKIRSQAKKRSTAKGNARDRSPTPIEPHAELRDQQGHLLAGIVRRGNEWVLGMGGRIAGSSDSAAHVFALIRRAAVLHESQGTPVRLTWSDALKDAAHAEAAAQGLSYEQFEERLELAMTVASTQKDNSL